MSHLLSISLGPVQDFIAAARRTADLYAGSQILQELSKEAARHLANNGATLIFPADKDADGANKILAEVTADPKRLAEETKKAVQERLLGLWNETIGKLPAEQRNLIDQARAKEQLGSFLEFYAAWVPLDGDYPQARLAVERLLAGRKALRDFLPTQQNDDGVPKSALDPARAAVIDPRRWAGVNIRLEDGTYRPLRIKPTEHLDALSLLKRCYGALKSGVVVDTRTMARRSWRPEAEPDERYGEEDDHIPEPQPYLAILVADGDRMGELIARQDDPQAHRGLSRTLDGFARKARAIVPQYGGFMVYSGGDDVLAFLPVNRAVECAKELSDAFRQEVKGTLSAGVALVHYREPLSISLQNARDAEKAAKNGGRNALAVALHTRGGSPVAVVQPWDELSWGELLEAYQNRQITRGLAHELRDLVLEWQDGMRADYLHKEAQRVLGRKEARGLRIPAPTADTPTYRKALLRFVDQLIIARFLSGLEEEAHAGTGA
ncbi:MULTISPECIES: type III-B CRISPR-associated protein Cas10/Cmr2 [unclassified Meiothermus]|uniref:type III-B CRISPR-associated protein Cas10/Cmr2 n=1 Tax=unclassified Meiothermus TaxID=370471 RepID=UPI000D7CCBC7|nr:MULTISPECIES: type III-B CRISPR-associated protein Cas10/Cmr2 [unclassified Meiothermus]PZA07710.1 type III-B CRISPR-associated protein Cas10/Cmr2 [Meiothermus sp. Pnk-1]RYM34476.1 type III-B CRISPR-associated protein Cas10/Cmr2 [Meiothermus sp. PNK-Is4]